MPSFEHPPVPPQGVEDFNEVHLIGAAAGTTVLDSKVTGDPQTRFAMTAAGEMSWGPGNAAKDIKFGRAAVGTLFIGPSSTEGLSIGIVGASLTIAEMGALPGYTLNIGTNNDRNVNILVGGGTTWTFGDTLGGGGHFYPGSDNTGDIGLTAFKVRNIRFGTQLLGPSGSALAPALCVRDGTYGFWSNSAATVDLSIASTRRHGWSTDTYFIFNDSAVISMGSAQDANIVRDAAQVVAQKNGTTAQTFRVYGTTTGPKYAFLTHDGTNGFISVNSGAITVTGATNVDFSAGGSSRWEINSSGHIVAFADNSYDFGASGSNRPRSIYWGTQLRAPDGALATPAYTFNSQGDFGFRYVTTNFLAVVGSSTNLIAISSLGIVQRDGQYLGWTTAADATAAPDAIFWRDGAGIIAQKNSTNAQKFRVYGTTTGPKYAELRHDGTDTYLESSSGNLYLFQNGAIAWGATSSAWTPAATDNALDLASSGNRARNVYWGTQLRGPNGSIAAPGYSFNAQTGYGIFGDSSASSFGVSLNGGYSVRFDNSAVNGITITAASSLAWNSGALALGSASTPDLVLVRDAAQTLAQKNSTNAQTFRVYGTTTGPKYTTMGHDGTDSFFDTTGGGSIGIRMGGSSKWFFNASTFEFYSATDNGFDVGKSGGRIRTLYAGTSVRIGDATAGPTWDSVVQSGASGARMAFSGTLSASPADFNIYTIAPTLAGAFTVTRLNYLDINNVAGAATVTDAAVLRFNAAIATHKALAASAAVAVTIGAGPTGSTAGNPQGWFKVNVNGTLRYVPFW